MTLTNTTKWEEIYTKLLEIEKSFLAKYLKVEPLYHEKNCIEFQVEFGEFLNETKCFKFWTTKKPQKDKVLEEFVDCLTMIFLFADTVHLTISSLLAASSFSNLNLLEIINEVYLDSTKLMHHLNSDLIKKLFSNLIYISIILNLNEDEIISAFNIKLAKVENRLVTDY